MFVFDGATPTLKKKTLVREGREGREKRKEGERKGREEMSYVREPDLVEKKVNLIPDLVPFSSWFLTIYSYRFLQYSTKFG